MDEITENEKDTKVKINYLESQRIKNLDSFVFSRLESWRLIDIFIIF